VGLNGKTTLTGRVLKHAALTTERYRAAFSAPTWKLMMETFEGYRNSLQPAISRVSREDRRIELVNGSVIEFWSSDDNQAGRGRRYHLWVSDESQRQRNLSTFIRGSVRPTLADFKGSLYVLATANGEGSELHDFYLDCLQDKNWFVAHGRLEENPYIDLEEINTMRRELGPELAAQELDSEWVRIDGVTPLVRASQWDQLYSEKENRGQRKVLAIDASVNSDVTALVAVWSEDNNYYVDYGDVNFIEPDVFTGEVDYLGLETQLLDMWATGKYAGFAYDPYQMVSLAQRLKQRGVTVYEFTQSNMRNNSDSYLRQVIGEARVHHPNHDILTEHVFNATLKFNPNNSVRIIKLNKNNKIDLAIALSMAVWTHKERIGNKAQIQYAPVVNRVPIQQSSPYSGLDSLNPYKR
jgi:hypothetical protein